MNTCFRFRRLIRLWVFALGALLLGSHACSAAVLINEVRPWSESMGVGDPLPSLFELYNAGAVPETLDTWWWMSDAVTAPFPHIVFPPLTYLNIVLSSGTDDSSFADSVATFYANVTGLNRAAGELAVFRGPPGDTTIEDFLSWGEDSSSLGAAYSYAVAAGMWPTNGYVNIAHYAAFSTLGRVPTGYDNDVPSDWLEIEATTVVPLNPHNPIQRQPKDGWMLESVELLVWKAVSGVTQYLVQVDDTIAFDSPVISQTVADTALGVALPDGGYYWRVIPQGIGSHPAAVWYFAQGAPPISTPPSGGFSEVPQRLQHKDSRLLCIWDLKHSKRPGCSEHPGPQGPWDNAHDTTAEHVSGCPHCRYYCARAAIQMVNAKFGGTLTQDEISYRISEDDIPGRPEGDLGHGKGCSEEEAWAAYSWALMGAAVGYWLALDGTVPEGTVRTEIDADRPILAAIMPGHAVVINGYGKDSRGHGCYHLMDPWPGQTGWYRQYRIKAFAYFTIPAGPIVGRLTDINVTEDADSDTVMNFDEGQQASGQVPRAFQSLWNDDDTDDDEVPDKQEIRAYTFHDLDHPGHNNDALNFPDVDGDGRRAENDCDSDNDGDFDGGEDIDGDGHNPEPPSETCMFSDTARAIGVSVTVVPGIGRSSAFLWGGSLHWLADYPYEVVPVIGCPAPIPGQGVSHMYSADTDPNGAFTGNFIDAFDPGEYRLIVDVLRDGRYHAPDNWDPWTCFTVAPDTGALAEPRDFTLFPDVAVGDVVLRWTPSAGANSYKIYRGTTFNFVIDGATYIGQTDSTTYTDVGVLATPGAKYYVVIASTGIIARGQQALPLRRDE